MTAQLIQGIDNPILAFILTSTLVVITIGSIVVKKILGFMEPRLRHFVPVDQSYNDIIARVRETLSSTTPTAPPEEQSIPTTSLPRRGVFDACPICLESPTFALETNCGHCFCGVCFVAYIRTVRRTAPVHCPICRREVSLLMTQFTDSERLDTSERKREIVSEIHIYNNRYSGRPIPWSVWIRDLPTLMRHMMMDFFSFGGLSMICRLRLIFCFFLALLYLLSPLDLIPEALFGILGLVDDFLILLILLMYCTSIYRMAVQNRT